MKSEEATSNFLMYRITDGNQSEEKIRQGREYEVWEGRAEVKFLDSGQKAFLRRPSLDKLRMIRKATPHRQPGRGAEGIRGLGHRARVSTGKQKLWLGQSRQGRGTVGAENSSRAGVFQPQPATSTGSSKHAESSHHGRDR